MISVLVRAGVGAVAIERIARARRRVAPITAVPSANASGAPSISVVVPARDEAARIGPLLRAVAGAPGVGEVIVVDDGSADATAAVARRLGATVVAGAPLPPGWAGKAWALQQGVQAAAGDWVVMLDADVRPAPGLPAALVARAVDDDLDLLTAAGRFDCPTAVLAWLHPAMLTTLVYRFGPPGAASRSSPGRLLANGQCVAAHRERLLADGAMTPVASATVEDVALVRHLAGTGRRTAFLDASELMTVRMYEDARDAWRGWSRSLSLPGVDPPAARLLGLVVVALAQALPLLRLVARRADGVDVALAAIRAGVLVGTARAYRRRTIAYWLSPAADVVAVAALARGMIARRQVWRGRTYPRP